MTTTFDELLRQHNDLCLRVSQNFDTLKRTQNEDATRIGALEVMGEDLVLHMNKEGLDLCKRVAALELVAARRVNGALGELDKRERATIEPAVEVIIRDQTTSIDEIKRACLMLGATRVVVDAGGIGSTLLRYLQADGLPAVAMAKSEKAWWKT